MDSTSWNPEWLYGVFIIVLGLAIGYGIMRNRSRTRVDKNVTERATEARYAQEDAKQEGRGQISDAKVKAAARPPR
jgi:uncharacterized membrane-anchored protein YhcB (DUF1043 family)